ncbi:MAG: DUF4861 family protein [Reichenbachiella sp.]
MRNTFIILLVIGLSNTLTAQKSDKQERDFQYAPNFRFCPDRDNDIAWENDLVAFRVYGKQPSEDSGLSGVDCWHKKVNYPILDRWYNHLFMGKSYHTDYGEGCDQYHVGNSRGCGGVGIWKDNQVLRSGLYESWELISLTQTTLKFKLVYRFMYNGSEIVENRTITLENGSQLYQAESQFIKNSIPLKDLEIAIGLGTTDIQDVDVTLNEDEGWFSVWHSLGNNSGKIGTGVLIETKYLLQMIDHKPASDKTSNAIAIVKTDNNGKIRFNAGFAWEQAGTITNKKDWNNYLSEY